MLGELRRDLSGNAPATVVHVSNPADQILTSAWI
jgi:hypothetical protein